MEELRSRLTGAEKLDTLNNTAPPKSGRANGSPPALPEKPSHRFELQRDVDKENQRSQSNGVIVCLLKAESAFTIDAGVLIVISVLLT